MPLQPLLRTTTVVTTAAQVRDYVTRQLAERLRPELEAALKANDAGGGQGRASWSFEMARACISLTSGSLCRDTHLYAYMPCRPFPLLPLLPPTVVTFAASAAPGDAYEFNAAACAKRALKNKALVGGVGVCGCVCVGGWGSRGGWGQA